MFDPLVPTEARLTLGEGWTPLEEPSGLAKALGLERLLLKREDLNPTGSHKDRGAAFQVSAIRHQRPGLRWMVISSSGNAAIAASAYAAEAAMKVAAFVAPGTAQGKLRTMLDLGALVLVTPKAISVATETGLRLGLPNLRPSTDPLAVEGFQTIGWELVEALTPTPVDAVFTFASSGTSFVALGRALARGGEVTNASWRPECHVVQGTGAHPIAGRFDARPVTEGRGRVGALGARKTRRLGEAVRLVEATGGAGWVITDDEAEEASRLLQDHGVDTSLEGAASVAAASRAARERGLTSAVVLLTGCPRDEASGTGGPGGLGAEAGDSHPRLRVVSGEGEAVELVAAAMAAAPDSAGTRSMGMDSGGAATPGAMAAAPDSAGSDPAASDSTGTGSAGSRSSGADSRGVTSASRRRAPSHNAVKTPGDFAEWADARHLSLAFAGTDPHYAIGLEGLVPELRVASTVESPALALLAERGVPTYSPEPRPEIRAPRSTAALLEEPGLADFLMGPEHASQEHARSPDGLLLFKPSHQVETRCAELGLRLLAPQAVLARRWENKVAFVDIAEGIDLRVPPNRVVDMRHDAYGDVAAAVGERFVLQSPHGFSGSKTMVVASRDELDRASERLRSPVARATKLIEGVPLTVNACLTGRGVACSSPFGQATGLAELTPYPLGSCGNDWSWAPARRLDPAPYVDITRRIGQALADEGYLGVFGVDFVLGDDGVQYVIEVNPRLVASIAMYTQLELAAGRVPMLARHVMAFLDPEADAAPLDSHLEPLDGSQVIVHELTGSNQVVGGAVRTGKYKLPDDASRLEYSGPALRIDELVPEGEVLVLSPSEGARVSAGASFARIQHRGRALGDEGQMVTRVARAVREVRAQADLRPAN